MSDDRPRFERLPNGYTATIHYDRPGHHPDCQFRIVRPPAPPYSETAHTRCVDGCPIRARLFDPIANARAALRRYTTPWTTWRS